MKIALVYDRINKWGGAERVLLALHELFPNAPIFTSVFHQQSTPWTKNLSIRHSFLQSFPKAATTHELYALLMPIAFESFSFDEYDLVISVTSEAAKGIITKPTTTHICYCLTPTRYLWSGYGEYFTSSLFRLISYPAVWYLRMWDTIASKRPDRYLTISHESKARIKKYYKRDASVIYPPVTLGDSVNVEKSTDKKYFLVVSRLIPYKRIDLAIKACNELGLSLKIVGVGSEKERLQKMSGPTIEFVGKVPDAELREYYKNCSALLFPGREDFGIVVVEAQSFGKPVIAFNAGGARETVLDKKTGILFPQQTVNSLKHAVLEFRDMRFDPHVLRKNSARFGLDEFKKQFLQAIGT